MSNDATERLEPWLRGTWTEIPAVARGVLHALELAQEDLERWAGSLTESQLHQSVAGLAPLSFQIRHIAGSIDRLLSYAEGKPLTESQRAALLNEHAPSTREDLWSEFRAALAAAKTRVVALASQDPNAPRTVGSRQLPSTLGGLLVHIADHTQRHVGQAIVTAKLVANNNEAGAAPDSEPTPA